MVILTCASLKILVVTVPPVFLSLSPWREAGFMTDVNSICPVKIFFRCLSFEGESSFFFENNTMFTSKTIVNYNAFKSDISLCSVLPFVESDLLGM